jgi:uncharacterized membrane protein YphA (DoxX/SURF4 family)
MRNSVSFQGKTPGNMRDVFLSRRLHLLIRVVLGMVFVYAGFVKLLDPGAFAKAVSQYGIVPEVLLAPFAVVLPALELLAGLGLVINIRGSLAVIFGLLVIFSLVLGYGIFSGMDIDCGCFSPEEISAHSDLRSALFRDLLMIVAAFYIYVYQRTRGATDPNSKGRMNYKEERI